MMFSDIEPDAPPKTLGHGPTARCEHSGPQAQAPYTTRIHPTIKDVDPAAWDQVVQGETLFLQRRYLAALEASAGEELCFRYVELVDGNDTVGVACFQLTQFVGQPIAKLLPQGTPLLSNITKLLGVGRDPFALGVTLCGSAFTSGEHGFRLAPEADPQLAMNALVAAAETIQGEAFLGEKSRGILFKEFYRPSEATSDRLRRHHFSELPSEPNMVLMLAPEWQTFSDYLASLSSKYRVKAKRAYAKSAALVARELSSTDVAELRPRLEELLAAVLERADYRLRCPGVAGLQGLRRALGEELVLTGYFLQDELVGFKSALADGETLEAHLVGFDYGLNREHGIYSRILYDYLQLALAGGHRRLNFGRTAGEIKSTLGAVPVEMICYVRHRHGTLNRLVPRLARAIRLPAFAQRKPFKQAWYRLHEGRWLAVLGLPRAAQACPQ